VSDPNPAVRCTALSTLSSISGLQDQAAAALHIGKFFRNMNAGIFFAVFRIRIQLAPRKGNARYSMFKDSA
jgi:hypothetical protein